MDSISNWQCTDCGLINFAEQLQCQACFADRVVSQQLIVRLKEREATMIVAFWLRTSMPDIHISYQHLDELMVRYYFVMKFEWNANTQIKPTMISDDLQTVTMINRHSIRYPMNSDCRSIYAQPVLSARTLSTVQWELTYKQKGYGDTRLFMGYVDADYIADFQNTMIVGYKDHQTAVFVKEGRRPEIFTNHAFTNMDTKRRYTCEIGDRFRLDMNFEERVCTAFCNDECLGIISKVLPQRLYLAVSLFGHEDSLECTLFEVVYKN